jgi:hypothetical protein
MRHYSMRLQAYGFDNCEALSMIDLHVLDDDTAMHASGARVGRLARDNRLRRRPGSMPGDLITR